MRERVLTYLFNIACTIFFVLLFFYSLTMTGYVPFDLSSELISFRQDNVLLNGMGIIILLVFWGGMYALIKKLRIRMHTRILAGIMSICSMLIAMFWVSGANVIPEADQWNVSFYANMFNLGDFSGFEKGNYIATCPHQLGIVTLLRIVYSIMGPDRFLGFRLLSVLGVGMITYVGYEIVRILTKKNVFAEINYLLLTVVCFPLYIYTLFIYGEVLSTAVLFVAAWLLLSCLERFGWGKVVALMMCAGLSVQLRQNSLIALLGFMVVLLVKIIQKFNWKRVAMIVVIPLGILVGNMCIDLIYQEHYEDDAFAIPNLLYITMGTNWEEQNPGWFSKYNYTVFFENDCDPEAAKEVAMADLKEFMDYCVENPDYALAFYKEKFISQWNDPMYHCLAMNCKVNYGEPQNPIVENFYFGELRLFTEKFMNMYQLLVYGAILYWLVSSLRKNHNIEVHVLMVGIFGGFLFSLIWEAKTRYIFPYFVMMLPYAAMGIEQIITEISNKLSIMKKSKLCSKKS